MNKSAIKEFAISARLQLLNEVSVKARYFGIGEEGYLNTSRIGDAIIIDGVNTPYSLNGKEAKTRSFLMAKIDSLSENSDYKTAYQRIIEEVAYTWFNRIWSIRFMELNDFHTSKIRVLSSTTEGKMEPDIVERPFDADLEYTNAERETIYNLKLDATKQDELFKFMFIKQCNSLSDVLPELFEKFENYTEMLFDPKFTNNDSVIRKIVNKIDEKDWLEAVEIIGWLYQFYNIEPKAKVDKYVKKGQKVSKEDIPAKTQLFTPDWIVRYLVDNSLGKLWIEHNPKSNLRSKLKYYLDGAEQTEEVKLFLEKENNEPLFPQDIKFIDPCMGSGHILVYAFEVLMNIYRECGYSERDIPELILEHNIYGLELDKRAYQLAYFALSMKARQYNKLFFKNKNISRLMLYYFIDSKNINKNVINNFGLYYRNKDKLQECKDNLNYIIDTFKNAKEYGSIMKIEKDIDYDELLKYLGSFSSVEIVQTGLMTNDLETQGNLLIKIVKIAKRLNDKYHIVCTNPPYMSSKDMNSKISNYCKKKYPNSKSDLFAVFMEIPIVLKSTYLSMINMQSWMFLSSYEKLRKENLEKRNIQGMLHLGARAFEEISGEVVQTTAFVLRNKKIKGINAIYLKLEDYKSQNSKEKAFNDSKGMSECKYRFECSTENFSKIPGSPIAYWVSVEIGNVYQKAKTLYSIADVPKGLSTGCVDIFMRYWYEVNKINIDYCSHNCKESIVSKKKWFPYGKGGSYRKWNGNLEFIVNWYNDGYEVKNFVDANGKQGSSPQNTSYYFRACTSY